MSPCELSLEHARLLGYDVQVVEKWVAPARKRIDYLGVIDILAINTTETLGIQCCRDGDMAAHRDKCLSSRRLALWLAGPARRFELWGWETRRSLERTKAGKRSRRLVHHLRREEITLAMFVPQQGPTEKCARISVVGVCHLPHRHEGAHEYTPIQEQPREAM